MNTCEIIKIQNVNIMRRDKDKERGQENVKNTEKDFMTIMNYRKETKEPKTFRLPTSLLGQLSKMAENSVLTETEIVICAIKAYLDEER